MAKEKKTKVKTGGLAYSFGLVGYNMEYMLVGQLSYALTDSYSFSAIAAGMIFLLSRFLTALRILSQASSSTG